MEAGKPDEQKLLIESLAGGGFKTSEKIIDRTTRPPEGILSKKKAIYALILASAGLFTAEILRNKDATPGGPNEPHGPYGSTGSYMSYGSNTGMFYTLADAGQTAKTQSETSFSYIAP